MKPEARTRILAVTVALALGWMLATAKNAKTSDPRDASPSITVFFGDVPVRVTVESCTTPVDLGVLAR